jgi:hypothetical protein
MAKERDRYRFGKDVVKFREIQPEVALSQAAIELAPTGSD